MESAAADEHRDAPAAEPDAAGGGSKRRRCEDIAGAEGAARKKARSRCPHGRERSTCTECGGAGLCPHQRRRRQCKECGGAGICQHQRRRSKCKECGGASICPHQRGPFLWVFFFLKGLPRTRNRDGKISTPQASVSRPPPHHDSSSSPFWNHSLGSGDKEAS